jgi:XisH protein
VDLGAQQVLAAERGEQKIAVEVKSFVSDSEMQDLREAIGQFIIYRSVLQRTYPEYTLYLAIRNITYESIFEEPIGQLMIEDENLKLIVFNSNEEVIVKWIL